MTLALPAAGYEPVIHLVFVIDDSHAGKTIFDDQVSQLLDELSAKENLQINLGIVTFDAVARDWISATSGGAYSGLVSIKDEAGRQAIDNAVKASLTYENSGEMKKVGATNLEWPLDMATQMLAEGEGTEKYLFVFSDLYGYVYRGDLAVNGVT